MLVLGKTSAYDNRGDRRRIKHPAGGDIGDRSLVSLRNLAERPQQALKDIPTTGGFDEAMVFELAPVIDPLSGSTAIFSS